MHEKGGLHALEQKEQSNLSNIPELTNDTLCYFAKNI